MLNLLAVLILIHSTLRNHLLHAHPLSPLSGKIRRSRASKLVTYFLADDLKVCKLIQLIESITFT